MKTLFTFLLLLTSASTAHAQLVKIEWNCPSIEYDRKEIANFPQKALLEIKVSGNKIEMEPNIFEEQGGFFSSSPDFSVDVSDCVQDLKKKFAKSSNKTQLFTKFLDDQKLLKRPTAARFYPGHTYKEIGLNETAKALRSLCSNEGVDPVVISSRSFLENLSKVIKNPLADLNSECLEKVNKFNSGIAIPSCSSESHCKVMKRDIEIYKKDFLGLALQRDKALSVSRSAEESFTPYRLSSSTVKSKIKEKLSEEDLSSVGSSVNSNFNLAGNYSDDMFYYDDAIKDAMPELLSQNRDYQEKFLEGYVATKLIAQDPLESKYCKENPCEDAKRAKSLFNENVQTLLNALYGQKLADNACFDVDKMKKEDISIYDLLDDVQKAAECSEIEVGETKVVSGVVTSTPSNYALTRKDKNTLTSTIVVRFVDGKYGTNVSADEMYQRANQCLKKTSTYFRSPSGETILVDLVKEEDAENIEATKRPEVQQVEILPKSSRAHSRGYDEDIDCQTITHEVLHLMGLCDEYKETAKKRYVDTATGKIINKPEEEAKKLVEKGLAKEDGLKYQCRAYATVDSIMATQADVMNAAIGSSITCECVNKNCKDLITHPKEKVRDLMLKDYTTDLKATEFCSYKDGNEFNVKSVAQLASLPSGDIVSQGDSHVTFKNTDIQNSYDGHLAIAIPYTISCKCAKESCRRDFKELKRRLAEKDPVPQKGCPTGLATEITRGDLPYGQSLSNGFVRNGDKFTMSSQAQRPGMSLLHPAHFERIKYGTCSDKAKTYTQCMKYAYRDECPDRPDACGDVNQWLLSEK